MLETIFPNVMGGKSFAGRPLSSFPLSFCVEGKGSESLDEELGRTVPFCGVTSAESEEEFCSGADLDLRGTATCGLVAGRMSPLDAFPRIRSVWRSLGGGGGPMVGFLLSVRCIGGEAGEDDEFVVNAVARWHIAG